jgi:hypothetical protein
MNMLKQLISMLAVAMVVGLVGTSANAALVGQLGILDTSGINPATGEQWKYGDKYHLVYVTTATTTATSTEIADYNAFVQGDANNQTVGGVNLGSVNWFALGSTASTNAINNAVITGPVFDIYHSLNPGDSATGSGFLATDAADFWDFMFPGTVGQNSGNPLSNLSGGNNDVWTGTQAGGTASSALGAGTSSRRHWTGWSNWVATNATSANSSLLPMVALSQELTVIPEPASLGLLGLGGLLLMGRRRRRLY